MSDTFTDPAQARKYIANFKHTLGRECTYVTFGDGETIHFDNMTDAQAVRVANGLLDLELAAGKGPAQ